MTQKYSIGDNVLITNSTYGRVINYSKSITGEHLYCVDIENTFKTRWVAESSLPDKCLEKGKLRSGSRKVLIKIFDKMVKL